MSLCTHFLPSPDPRRRWDIKLEIAAPCTEGLEVANLGSALPTLLERRERKAELAISKRARGLAARSCPICASKLTIVRFDLPIFVKSIADELAAGERQMAVRLSASLTTALEALDTSELASLPEPAPSGDDVADALAAALVEFACLRRGAEVPFWCRSGKREADPWWFALDNPRLRPLILCETPPSLAVRGVFISERSLASV